jgi:hypothetical protein
MAWLRSVTLHILLVCKGHWRHKYEKDGMAKVGDLILLVCTDCCKHKFEKDGMAKVRDLILLVCKGHWRHKYEKDGMTKANEHYTSQGQMLVTIKNRQQMHRSATMEW